MARSRIVTSRLLELLVVAIVGGALALGGAALLGKLGDRTTIQQVTTTAGTRPAAPAPPSAGGALSPERIYLNDSPGVVQITATSTSTSQSAGPFNLFPTTPQTSQSLGSGFVIDQAGHIVTNFHVIQGAQTVKVSFSGQDELAATVVGKDPSTDIAVLKVNTHARALTPLELGDSDAVRVGDPVYAIGNPFGLARTLTTGVVSALQRQIFAPNSLPIDSVIQTDAAINHGNSGGPLLDAEGRVIGVTSQIQTGSDTAQGNVGIGFAIPINTVRTVASQIIGTGTALHAFLGVGTAPITAQLAQLFNLPVHEGLLVQEVTKGSGASRAGLQPGQMKVVVEGVTYQVGGDIIVSFDGVKVTTTEQLRDAIARRKPGDSLKLEIYRHGSKKTVTATLGKRPGS